MSNSDWARLPCIIPLDVERLKNGSLAGFAERIAELARASVSGMRAPVSPADTSADAGLAKLGSGAGNGN